MTEVPGISLRGVCKTYRGRGSEVVALQNMNLDCPPGSFTALIGPSGCGKSTALRLIAGLVTPSSGTVRVSHRADRADRRHSIGFVFQEPTLMPWATRC